MIAYQEVFDRHPGVYDVMHTTERPGKRDGMIETVRVATHLRISAPEVIALIRREVAADASAVMTIYAATRGDTGCIGWISRKNIDHQFREVTDGRMELPHERRAATLLPRAGEPLQEVGDSPAAGEVQRPGAVQGPRPVRAVPAKAARGKGLVLGTGEWPPSAPAQLVRSFYAVPGTKATPAEAVAAIGPQLTALGVAFPASCISRLKQQGLLVTAPED